MNYFKHKESGKVFAYDDDQLELAGDNTDLVPMTKKEIEIHLNPPVSKEQHIAEAEQKKQFLLDEAERHIAILERKVRLEMATDDEKDLLTAWEIYSVKTADADTSKAPDIDWGVKPE
ncbi:tail fiber assembly protein [Providencia rustigianii]|uniref:Caudovirales tail fiber assembly protein n=1 Tax=Providencia rustigianii DSM 4541 TaxID=500637 RepID=D1P8C4_9GAMM|nr:tail fiber assembly protein [Providencia rustigianii]EFB70361.1 caudovirales tail fiber assembly protein [Providencia rustigianii DSM 4541]SUC29006.1 Caudovirales tail fibre assembly protein [Providencia rustigianii]